MEWNFSVYGRGRKEQSHVRASPVVPEHPKHTDPLINCPTRKTSQRPGLL